MSAQTILDVRAVLDAYFDGINGERYEDVAALFAADGVLVAPGVKPRNGRDSIAAYFGLVLARYPVHHDQATRTMIDGTTATVEIAFTGELESGAPMRFEAVDVFDLDAHGRITRLVTWYDSHLVRARITDAEARHDAAARTRSGLHAVREGVAIPLPGATWRTPPAGPLANRARVIDSGDAVEPKPGDVLLVRSHGAPVDLAKLPLERLTAVVTDGVFAGETGLPNGEGWDLTAARAGLLVSVPSADGAANAAIWT